LRGKKSRWVVRIHPAAWEYYQLMKEDSQLIKQIKLMFSAD
jgi:hypothetical protein